MGDREGSWTSLAAKASIPLWMIVVMATSCQDSYYRHKMKDAEIRIYAPSERSHLTHVVKKDNVDDSAEYPDRGYAEDEE